MLNLIFLNIELFYYINILLKYFFILLILIFMNTYRPGNRGAVSWNKTEEENEEMYTVQQAQIKHGWSLLATLYCVLLPDKVAVQGGTKTFKRLQVEMMARRWQHQCVEVCC